MQFTKERLSSDEKLANQDADFDLEAGTQTDGRPSPFVLLSQPSFKQQEEQSLLRKILEYPAPNSLKINSTAWLNGVRGVAAFLVYVFHAFGIWFPIVPAWHADPLQNNVLQLPMIRTVFVSGGAAVSVFFALSGYVLTHRSLHFIREGSRSKVQPAVFSSMFRRGIRLYLPPVLLTFCEMLATRWGFPPPLNFTFVAENSFGRQFVDWIIETNKFVNPMHNFWSAVKGIVVHPKYDPVIWTIPLEFYGSFVCYILLLTLVRVPKNRVRMGLVAIFSVCSMFAGSWNFSCFSAGMLIADFNLGQEQTDSGSSTLNSLARQRLWTTVLVVAFYVAGFPTLGNTKAMTDPMPGFEMLRSLIPTWLNMEDLSRFLWSISGVSILFSISQVSQLKRVFETYICQYLAKISFSLYLVHEFCIVLFGLTFQTFLLQIFSLEPKVNTFMYCIVCIFWFMAFTLPVFSLAAQVEKWVDVPSVRFAKWLEGKYLKVYRGSI